MGVTRKRDVVLTLSIVTLLHVLFSSVFKCPILFVSQISLMHKNRPIFFTCT